MKILAVADIEAPYFWDYYEKEKLAGIDLILSAGDLDAEYLSFLATMSNVPVLYVHGNHDSKYDKHPPEGCFCIEDQIYVHEGIRILGLGGSMRYSLGGHQYTQKEMNRRIRKLAFPLIRYQSFDILLTHSPARHLHDGNDLPHHGFELFNRLLERFQPKYFIHGHVHQSYGKEFCRQDAYKSTTIINACGYFIFEY